MVNINNLDEPYPAWIAHLVPHRLGEWVVWGLNPCSFKLFIND